MQRQSYWEKQRQKAMQKLADPEWREEQRAKRLQQAQRQQQRAREKAASPEYRQKKLEKVRQSEQRRRERAASALPKKTRPSRGLKGRSLTAEERRIQDAIGNSPVLPAIFTGSIALSYLSTTYLAERLKMPINTFSLCVNGTTSTQRQQRSANNIPGWFLFMLMEK